MFSRKPKPPSGVVVKGLSPDESRKIITMFDTKKKKKGFWANLLGEEDPGSKISVIGLDRISRIIRMIENVPETTSINLILHTLGGSSLAANLLIRAMLNHPGPVRVFIPQYAFSAGTLIALAADEIYMPANASLGPVDLQVGGFPLNSIMDSLKIENKEPGYLSTYLKSYTSRVSNDGDQLVKQLLQRKFGDQYSEEIYTKFSQTHHHEYPMGVTELKELGLEIHDLKVSWRNVDKIGECNLEIPKSKVSEDNVEVTEIEEEKNSIGSHEEVIEEKA